MSFCPGCFRSGTSWWETYLPMQTSHFFMKIAHIWNFACTIRNIWSIKFSCSPDYTTDAFYNNPTKLGDCATTQCFKDAITANMNHLLAANTFTATAIERAVKVKILSSKASLGKKSTLAMLE